MGDDDYYRARYEDQIDAIAKERADVSALTLPSFLDPVMGGARLEIGRRLFGVAWNPEGCTPEQLAAIDEVLDSWENSD